MKVHSDPLFHAAMCSGTKKTDQSLTHFCCWFRSVCFVKISQYRGKKDPLLIQCLVCVGYSIDVW